MADQAVISKAGAGLGRAVGIATEARGGVGAPAVEAPGDQLPLAIAGEAAPRPPEGPGSQAPDGDGVRRPGRPPGSLNKRTTEWTNFLLARYKSPLVVLAETYTRPIKELAQALGCTIEDAFRIQLTAARELAPYVHQKAPPAVQVDEETGVITLVMHDYPDTPTAVEGAIIEGEVD